MTDMQSSGGAIIKADEHGRVRTPAARRESLLVEFDQSGLSGPKFAALAGIKYQTFAGWVRRRRLRPDAANAPAKPIGPGRWLEAVVAEASPTGALVLQWPGGLRTEVGNERQAVLAAALIQALARPC
jgi:hypothetical protein